MVDDVKREMAELQDRIDKSRAEREEIERGAEQRKKLEKLRDDAELEERTAKEAAAIERLEAEHGPNRKAIYCKQTAGGLVVVKKPQHLVFRKYRADVSKRQNGVPTDEDLYKIVLPHLLYPEKEAFSALLESFPHALLQAANAVGWLAGARKEEVEGE